MADPTIPEITDEEAAVLRLHSIPFSHYYAMLHADNRGLLDIRSGSLTALGRAALAKHLADRERDVRRKAIEECCASAERWDNDVGFAEGPADWIRREVQP